MNSFNIDSDLFVIDEYITNVDIISLLENKNFSKFKRKIFLCPSNALVEKNNVITKDMNLCTNCKLCDIKYLNLTSVFNKIENSNIDNILISLPHISILLNILFPEAIIATEVKVDGNSRNKRIDLILKKENKIFIFKILTDIKKLDFYYRSYTKIKDLLVTNLHNIDINVFLLVSSKVLNSYPKAKEYKTITLNQILDGGLFYGYFNK